VLSITRFIDNWYSIIPSFLLNKLYFYGLCWGTVIINYLCYSCDVASSKLRRSRTTFNKSLVNFTLIASISHQVTKSIKKIEERRSRLTHFWYTKVATCKTLASWQNPLKNFVHVLLGLNKTITKLLRVIYSRYVG
jgi:hypothetical protein